MSARKQVAERVQALLEEREVAPGDRLPPERQLAVELGVSRSTLREGLRRLIDLGIVEARQGSGTYVAPPALADLLRRSRDTTASDPAVRAATLVELECLVEAIRAGDAAGAEGAMRAHLRDVGTALAEAP